MAKFTRELIKRIAPRASAKLMDALPALFNEMMPTYGINNQRRIALFLANTLTETGGFRQLEENLNYSAKRLRQVWPARFPTNIVAQRYAHNPEALANFVYNRLGNKGKPGFGWKYRGSGLMQTTFIDNYRVVENITGLPVVDKPEMLRQPREAVLSACIFWQTNGCNELADANRITECRRVINGGTHGLKTVKKNYGRVVPMVADIKFGTPKTNIVIGGSAATTSAAVALEQSGGNMWVIVAIGTAALAIFAVMVYRTKRRQDYVRQNQIDAQGIQDSADQLGDDPHKWLLMDRP